MKMHKNKIIDKSNKITWVNLLHFYQPPAADRETVIEAAEKSYKKIISALKKNPKIKFTLNLAGCLLEKLEKLGYKKLIADIKLLNDRKQIELTGTAASHQILPLLPRPEIKRNIEINKKILKKFFGKNLRTPGFFLPELAFSAKVARIIANFGYKWIILDEISAYGKLNKLNLNKLYLEKNTGLKIFFRKRLWSRSYVPERIFSLIKQNYNGFALTATDAELYGLRHNDRNATFERLLKRPEIKTLTISEFLANLKESVSLRPLDSSWESTAAELKRGQPFILWRNDKNKIQKLLWQLADLAMATINRNQADENYRWARLHLDNGLASCTFWWASARDFKLFSSISWSPDEIERGANELIKSIRSLEEPKTLAAKIAGEKLYIKIKQLIWHKHWNHYWKK